MLNEKEWLDWRSKGIGSSDIASIIGISPYKTKYQLWEQKAEIKKDDFKGNWATERGKRLEPKVRFWINKKFNLNLEPKIKIHKDNPIFRASADGVDEKTKTLIEIKCPGKIDHCFAATGEVPIKYYPQCQWLMMVFDYDQIFYISYNEDYIINKINADKKYQEYLAKEAMEFWELVKTKNPPKKTEDEDIENLENEDFEELFERYHYLKTKESEIKAEIAITNKLISEKMTKKKGKYKDYQASWIIKKGSIDYSKIDILKDINLEEYRKKDIKYFQIKKISN